MFDQERLTVEARIRAILTAEGIPAQEPFAWNAIPFSGEWGLALPLFPVAAQEARAGKKINVPARTQEIAALLVERLGQPEGFARLEAVRGYLNLYFSTAEYSRRVIDAVLEQGPDYGRGAPNGQQVMVEYSQPNTHKPLHVGHLRNMILGAAVCSILETAGYKVVRANYPGDTGLHVISWLWNYLKNHAGEEPPADKLRWMGDLYAEAVRLLEDNPEYQAEMRQLFQRWEAKDPDLLALWQKTRQWSYEAWETAYQILGIHFDLYYWQSDVDDAGKQVVAELIARGLAVDERPEGPVIVCLDELLGLEKETYRVMIALRSDSTALYATWDLALAIRKFSDYDLARSIYVVDVRQSLHLKQIFKTLELLGYPWTDRLFHLPYEIVNLPGNVTMKSREGTVVLLEDFLREAVRLARRTVEEKNPDLAEDEKDRVAQAVAIGSIKYPLLARDNTKIATFDWETALDFNGQAAPYIQYAQVRANSILRRAGELPASRLPAGDLAPAEIQLIDLISRLPAEVQRAAADLKALHLTNLVYDLARAFNDFYNQCPVLNAPAEARPARLRLTAAARQAIQNLLVTLGIPVPEVM